MWSFNQDPLEAYYEAVKESQERIAKEKDWAFQRRLVEKRRVARNVEQSASTELLSVSHVAKRWCGLSI